jgi:branched-chain amino acid transport system ATP-binding protein
VSTSTRPLLDASGVTVRIGGSPVLDDVSVQVGHGRVVGLIGPNGAGKTTFIDAITGFVAPAAGSVRLAGTVLDGRPPHERARLGLTRTFQSLELFEDLTVAEHLEIAVSSERSGGGRRSGGSSRELVEQAMDRFDLGRVASLRPPELSHGRRKQVALARAVVHRPALVVLDEPVAGLDRMGALALSDLVRALPGLGTTVLLSDHDMDFVLDVCATVHVLERGRLVASGPPATIRSDPRVTAAYLGSADPLDSTCAAGARWRSSR